MRYYICGPMSHMPQSNFPMFYAVARDLRSRGYEIISPAELDDDEDKAAAMASSTGSLADHPKGKTWADFLSRDVKIVADEVQGLIFLPGWTKSRGAKLEAFVGILCKHKFYEWTDGDIHPLTAMDVMAMISEIPE
jgi:hypothetical protein